MGEILKVSDEYAIELQKLSRSFTEGSQRHDVLDAIDARFASGELVAVRGRSGSGKSTLLNLIAGIDIPDSGEVRVAGVRLGALSERDRTLFRRRNIGFVYQSFNLIPALNVADNLRLVLELNRIADAEAEQRIRDLLEATGLAARAGSSPDVLSGGEQQRVAVARALCHRPSVVLADEPTGNLDDANATTVLRLLQSLVRDNGATLVVATHSARVAAICDRVLEISAGKLCAAVETRSLNTDSTAP